MTSFSNCQIKFLFVPFTFFPDSLELGSSQKQYCWATSSCSRGLSPQSVQKIQYEQTGIESESRGSSTYVGYVSFRAYDAVLWVLTELNIVIFGEGMPADKQVLEWCPQDILNRLKIKVSLRLTPNHTHLQILSSQRGKYRTLKIKKKIPFIQGDPK